MLIAKCKFVISVLRKTHKMQLCPGIELVAPIGSIAEALQLSRVTLSDPLTELELRLGRTTPAGDFVASVDALWFSTLLRRLELCPDWVQKTHWIETEDNFFRDLDGQIVRQTRLCDPDTCCVRLDTVCKQRQSQTVVPTPQLSSPTNEILPSRVNAVRFAVSREEPVDGSKLPNIVEVTHTRIKQRKRFAAASHQHPGCLWWFDLTRTWGGQNREDAEQKQHSEPATHEVEIEFHCDPASCKTAPEPNTVLHALLLKAVSLLQ